MARWQQVVGEGWVQWADLRLADAWFRQAQLLATAEIANNIDLQKNRTRDAWIAIGNGFRALDTPPYNSPTVRGAIRRAYGSYGFGTNLNDPGSFWTNGDNPGTTDGPSAFAREVKRLYLTQRPMPDVLEFKIRYLIDQVGLPIDACASPVGGCYNPQPYWMDNTGPHPRQISGEVSWDNWGFWDGGAFAWLAAQTVGRILPPTHWSMQLVKEIADQCVAFGALEVLTQARLNSVLLNFRMAQKHHLLSNDALLHAAAYLPADLEHATWSDDTQGAKPAARAIIQAGQAVGGLYGALIGAAGVALSWAPASVGTEYTDMFGRAEPVFENPNISGGAGDATSTQRLDVPDPPGYVPLRSIAFLPPVFILNQPPSIPRAKLAQRLGLPTERSLPPTLTDEEATRLLAMPDPQLIAQFRADHCEIPPLGLHSQVEVDAWNVGHPWCPIQVFNSGQRSSGGGKLVVAGLAALGIYLGYRVWQSRKAG